MAAIPGRPDPWQTLGKLFAALVAAGVLVAGLTLPLVGGVGLVAGHEADRFRGTACKLQESKPPQRTTLYARDGKTVIATLFSQDRVPIPLSQIPTYTQDALVATEDRRFYSHHGVDMRGLLRSAVSTSGGNTQGGSTLTMQYVKQIRYYQAGDDLAKQNAAIAQNLNRKIEDAKCALYIEGDLHESKGMILQNYLNIAFFGEHSYGIQTAAETYFNKPAAKLTLGESALLIGMLRAPSDYDPFVNRAAAKLRRDEVLQNLVAVGKLSQATADKQKALPLALATDSPPQIKQGCANANTTVSNAAFFCEYTRNWLQKVDQISNSRLQTGGLKVVTTLDAKLQKSAQQQIEKAVPASSPMTSVLPVLDPHTGDILAMATNKHFGAKGKTETEQPVFTSHTALGASTYKLFPLLAALSTGVPSDWTLKTVGSTGIYKPQNCLTVGKGASNGDANEPYTVNETLESATVKSSNTFYVGLADQLLGCRLGSMVDIATKLGMKSLDEPSDIRKQTIGQAVVSQQRAQLFVLGSVPTSPLELAGAYAAVANGGKFNAPAPVLSVTDSSGAALPVHRTPGVQVVAPQVAAQAVQILKGDTKAPGTSTSAFAGWYSGKSSIIAGKTGTNESNKKNENSSVWFVGLTPDLVAASALINFDQSSAPSQGLPGMKTGEAYGDYASKIWLKALKPTLAAKHWTWENPDNVAGAVVPNIEGLDLGAAKAKLADQNLKMTKIDASDLRCPSTRPLDTVAYYGPHRAAPGSTITVCPSTGSSQPVYYPPVITKPKPRSHPSGGSSSSASRGGGRGGGGRGGGGRGGGGSGHPSPGPGGH